MQLRVNGIEHAYEGDGERTLLDYLRRDLQLISVKDGCSPQAVCGCCLVHVGGTPTLACVTPMSKLAGAEVRTLEGIETIVRDTFADAFSLTGGAQCGFCIPGIVMRAAALLQKDPDPSEDTIARELRGHLCRCTGYKKIISAIQLAGESLRTGEPIVLPEQSGKVGTRLPRYDARRLVLGERPYVADMRRPGMLQGALRLSDHPRARVRAIHTEKAAALPGVERVFLADAIAGLHTSGLILSDWPLLVGVGETTCYTGDVLACVAAQTRDVARQAASLIEVEYEVLEPVTDPVKALEVDSPKVHPDGNLMSISVAKVGDAEAAFADCAYISQGVYETQRIEHGYLEPEACLAEPTASGVRVFSQGQGVYEDRRQLAALLNLEEPAVEVVLVPNGGGFGGKEDLSVQGHAALIARTLGRPVMVEISRDESIRMHPKRHPMRLAYKLGCDAGGKLVALHARIIGDSGAYASVGMKVLERAAGHATGAYTVPNVDVEARAVYTNNVPCGAMRGFGANQANFALESCVDDLCAQGGFDPWQFRWDNALTDGGTTATGQRLTSGVGVRATLAAVQEVYRNAKYAGIACGLKNTGIGNGMPDASTAKIVIRAPDAVEIHHGWTEMGQGINTVAVHTFCQETGLSPDIVQVLVQTEAEAPAGMTTASRATSLLGNALIDACKGLVTDLKTHTLGDLVGKEYRGEWVCDWTTKPGHVAPGQSPVTHYSYSYATQVVVLDDAGEIEKVVAAHDAGKIYNPTLFEGQIEGSVHMGLGYALTEDLPYHGGHPEFTRLRKCGILTAPNTPAIEVIGVEVPDGLGPYGAKGVGEIGLVPTAPAVANALFAYDGKRRYRLPMKRKR